MFERRKKNNKVYLGIVSGVAYLFSVYVSPESVVMLTFLSVAQNLYSFSRVPICLMIKLMSWVAARYNWTIGINRGGCDRSV